MRNLFFSAILFLLLPTCVGAAGIESSICTIISLHPTKGEFSQSSGFIFQETPTEYSVMTAKHGIIQAQCITHVAMFHHPTWHSYILKLKTFNKERDTAILTMHKDPDDKISRKPWKINNAYKPKPYERLGFMSVTPDDGLNMKYVNYMEMKDPTTFRLRGHLATGNSGGVLFNQKYEAIGVMVSTSDAGISSARTLPNITEKAVSLNKTALGMKPSVADLKAPVPDLGPLLHGTGSFLPALPLRGAESGN